MNKLSFLISSLFGGHSDSDSDSNTDTLVERKPLLCSKTKTLTFGRPEHISSLIKSLAYKEVRRVDCTLTGDTKVEVTESTHQLSVYFKGGRTPISGFKYRVLYSLRVNFDSQLSDETIAESFSSLLFSDGEVGIYNPSLHSNVCWDAQD